MYVVGDIVYATRNISKLLTKGKGYEVLAINTSYGHTSVNIVLDNGDELDASINHFRKEITTEYLINAFKVT